MSPSIGTRTLSALAALCFATTMIGLATGFAPASLSVAHVMQA